MTTIAQSTLHDDAGPVSGSSCKLSIIIKALNEEQHIAAAIRSALRAMEPFAGEVILADSASTDRTVVIAERYPITIVRLANAAERRCGIGPQLGYQFARGQYVYILDGDMELDAAFMRTAVDTLDRNPELGGVAGLVTQQADASYQFRGLARRRIEGRGGDVAWLDMGGLYRRSALQQVGYLSNRNLHAFEEMELGMRLSGAGWMLRRLDIPSVRHHGYDLNSLALLKHRWRSRYLLGAGEVLRASWRRPYFLRALLTQKFLLLALLIWVGLVVGLLALPASPWPIIGITGATLALIALRALRIGSLKDALIGQLVWQVHALAFVWGIVMPMQDPGLPIAAELLQDFRADCDPPGGSAATDRT